MRFVNTKTALLLIIIVILLLLIKNIVGSIIILRQNSRIVTDLSNKEKSERQKKEFLMQRLYFVKSSEFIENEAREKLGMTKEGEHIILEPAKIEQPKASPVDTTPRWRKWINLFL